MHTTSVGFHTSLYSSYPEDGESFSLSPPFLLFLVYVAIAN